MTKIHSPENVNSLDYYISFKRSFTKNQTSISVINSVKDNLRQAELVKREPIGLFLCYTAEEEAATFVYLCIKERGYNIPDFKRLNSHHDKIKIFLLALCINTYLFSEILLEDALVLMMEEVPKDKSHPRHEIRAYTEVSGYQIAITDPILNIKTRGSGEEGLNRAVREDVEAALKSAGLKDNGTCDDMIKLLANRRNLCLYGEPKIKARLDSEEDIKIFENNCLFLICLGYMFLQTEKNSEAVQKIINYLFDKIGWVE